VLTAIPDVIDLTRTNPALKSDETQKLRSSDRFRRYSDDGRWGQAKGLTHEHRWRQPLVRATLSRKGKVRR
jgi:hypothetical protein